MSEFTSDKMREAFAAAMEVGKMQGRLEVVEALFLMADAVLQEKEPRYGVARILKKAATQLQGQFFPPQD
jgi:hypothetical protein